MFHRSLRPIVLALLLVAALPAVALAKGGADLSVVSLSFTAPTVAKPGDAIQVIDGVKSAGAAAPGSTVAYFLSLDAKKSRDDVRLTGKRSVGALKRNGTAK